MMSTVTRENVSRSSAAYHFEMTNEALENLNSLQCYMMFSNKWSVGLAISHTL